MRRRHTIGICDYDYDDDMNITVWYDRYIWSNNIEYKFQTNDTIKIMNDYNMEDKWNSLDKRIKHEFIEKIVLKICEDKIFPLLPKI